MPRKLVKVAFLKDVTIRRDGDYAHVDFIDPNYASRSIGIGPEVAQMSDEEILRLHNDMVIAEKRSIAQSRPGEMQKGLPQIKFDKRYRQWFPQGEVLRCELASGSSHDELIVEIDDKKLSWDEFGDMLKPYMGWGMRVVFVHPEQLTDPPQPEILIKGRDD
jgi:hypothetical protein